jgi:CheY-like chemotaxis protein
MEKSASPFAGMTALVVDDDAVVRVLLARILIRMGFSVRDAIDGAAALEVVSSEKVDLVITDLSMPGMDGMAFMREARARGLAAPVIFLTATASIPTAVEAIKLGAFEFLEKPLNSHRLAEVVGAALASRAADDRAGAQALPTLTLQIDVEEPVTGAADVAEGAGPGRPFRRVGMPSIPTPGTIPGNIGRYEVEAQVGRGGMGIVYRCRDPLLGRIVAVKVLSMIAEDPKHAEELISRFKREAAAAGTLHHPNIVSVYDMGCDEDSGDWYLVMELVEGRGLNRVMDERGKIPERDVISLGFQVADALAYAHAFGVAHRDIKPSNVLIQADGRSKLLDFGLAAVRGWNVTLSSRILGSPSYMAPERIRGEGGGTAADQFSLGVVLYECLSGKNPFEGDTLETRFLRVLQHNPPPVIVLEPEVSPRMSAMLETMMAKDDQARFPTMHNVADTLLLQGKEVGLDLKRHIAPPR